MRINVTVTPNAKVPMVTRIDGASYKVKVDARALEGRANERLVELLAKHFGVPERAVRIVRGDRARSKVVEIDI